MKGNIKSLEIVGYTITSINGGYWIKNEVGDGMPVTKLELKEMFDAWFRANY